MKSVYEAETNKMPFFEKMNPKGTHPCLQCLKLACWQHTGFKQLNSIKTYNDLYI